MIFIWSLNHTIFSLYDHFMFIFIFILFILYLSVTTSCIIFIIHVLIRCSGSAVLISLVFSIRPNVFYCYFVLTDRSDYKHPRNLPLQPCTGEDGAPDAWTLPACPNSPACWCCQVLEWWWTYSPSLWAKQLGSGCPFGEGSKDPKWRDVGHWKEAPRSCLPSLRA